MCGRRGRDACLKDGGSFEVGLNTVIGQLEVMPFIELLVYKSRVTKCQLGADRPLDKPLKDQEVYGLEVVSMDLPSPCQVWASKACQVGCQGEPGERYLVALNAKYSFPGERRPLEWDVEYA
jgi:hypothetical protein